MNKKVPIYKDPSKSMEERIACLINQMTLEEKISQMINESKAIPRLDIPEYNWWSECLHGVARAGIATVFPQAIGLAATFDTDLVLRVGTAISDEARAKYNASIKQDDRGINKGLTFWSPNINIFRDPRWGRGQETYGEDPYLTGQIGTAFVKGLQGDHPKYLKTAACAKHYAVHSGPEKDRHHFNAKVSLKDLHETYLPAFKTLVEAGVESIMGAYNRTNDEPCCGSKTLLIDVLRNRWGFKGHVVSDCGAINDIHENHKVTKNPEESAAMAVKNGCDLNCGCTYNYLILAVEKGLIDEKEIDRALANLFRTRFKLGMFDPSEMVPYSSIRLEVVNCDAHRKLARETAVKSIVLLKNKNNILPFKEGIRNIYVVGPLAADIEILLGNYNGYNDRLITIVEGLVGKSNENTFVSYKQGCLLDRERINPLDWSLEGAKDADAIIAVMGITPAMEGEEGDAMLTKEKGDRIDIRLPENQLNYLKQLSETGTPLIVVLAGGSPLAVPEVHEMADAVLFIWYPGEEGGNAVADIIFGDAQPSGRLPITFPKSINQVPSFDDYNITNNRTYKYLKEEPLYPFGFGLGYAQFEYKNLKLAPETVKEDGNVKASVEITNKSAFAGEEVIQLYISDIEASVIVPKYELKKFKRISLKPGETRKIQFTITPEMLKFVDNNGERKLEPGEFKVFIGGSSPGKRSEELEASKPVSATFTLK